MSRLVLVDKDQLETLLMGDYEFRREIAVEGGCASKWDEEWQFLDPDDVLVTLAVQAGLLVPGPMKPGTVPPAPPAWRFASHLDRFTCAATYRTKKDPRLRCEADAKVVYTTLEQAAHAASLISGRQPMKAYLGPCGHYHVSRRKG